MRYLEKPREFHGLPLVSVRSLLILSASSLSLWLGAPAQAQSPPSAAVQPPPVVRPVGTDIAAPTPPPPDVLLPAVGTHRKTGVYGKMVSGTLYIRGRCIFQKKKKNHN